MDAEGIESFLSLNLVQADVTDDLVGAPWSHDPLDARIGPDPQDTHPAL